MKRSFDRPSLAESKVLKDDLTELDKAIIRLVEAMDEPPWVLQAALGYAMAIGSLVTQPDTDTLARLAIEKAKSKARVN